MGSNSGAVGRAIHPKILGSRVQIQPLPSEGEKGKRY